MLAGIKPHLIPWQFLWAVSGMRTIGNPFINFQFGNCLDFRPRISGSNPRWPNFLLAPPIPRCWVFDPFSLEHLEEGSESINKIYRPLFIEGSDWKMIQQQTGARVVRCGVRVRCGHLQTIAWHQQNHPIIWYGQSNRSHRSQWLTIFMSGINYI